MALSWGTVWEVRTTGLAVNGGGFFPIIPGTSVDYSQQNGAQLSITDGACLLASVTLTSVIGGFTASMVGNLIQIRAGGVNFVAGFYQIVLWNSVNSVNLDRTPVAAGNGTGGLGEVGGAIISPEVFITNSAPANTCYVKSGTYTFTANRTYSSYLCPIIGYDTSRAVTPMGVNRPLFVLGAFSITFNNIAGSAFSNVRFTGTNDSMLKNGTVSTGIMFINCKIEHLSVAGTKYLIDLRAGNGIGNVKLIDCELLGTAGATTTGITHNGNEVPCLFVAFCFFHDLTYAYYFSRPGFSFPETMTCFFKNIFKNVGYPIYSDSTTGPGMTVIFNSFYQSFCHIYVGIRFGILVYGNTFDTATYTAIYTNVVNKFIDIENNDFWNNGAVVFSCFLDINNIGLDPLWVNPAGNDFSFGPGSPNIDQALGIRLGV